MTIAFNTKPLNSGHKYRGVGQYTRKLLDELKKRDLEIYEFDDSVPDKDVDLVHYPWFDLFFRNIPLRQKFPTVVTIHDVIPLIFNENYPVGIKGKINLSLQKLALSRCKKIITVSETSKKDIIKYLNVKEDKINVIYEAADEDFKLLPDSQKLKVKRKYNLPEAFLLYIGDANFVKNLPFLIEGFNTLKKNKDLKLVLIGNVFLKKTDNIDHPELDSLKLTNELIEKYSLTQEILRPGQVDTTDLVGFYNLATCLIQPSLYEGFGIPILEAFSCGCPVISSSGGSLPEVGGSAAIYFSPNDQAQFVRLVSEALNSNYLRVKLARMGLKRAEKFSWEKTADETIKIYKEIG